MDINQYNTLEANTQQTISFAIQHVLKQGKNVRILLFVLRLNPANLPWKPFLSFLFFPFPSFLQLSYSDSFRDGICKHFVLGWGLGEVG